MLNATKTIYKNKIGISINNHITCKTYFLLICLFHHECFFHFRQHRNCSFSCFCFRCINGKSTSFRATLIKINKCVVNIYCFFFKVNVAPPKSGNLTHTHSSPQHNRKNRIPSVILPFLCEEIFKQI